MINGSVRITQSVEIPVRSPAITDHRSTRFDPSIYNGHQGVGGSVRYWKKECSARFTFDTAKHPLPLTGRPLLYFRRPNMLSSISTILLGPQSFSEQPSIYCSIVSLQGMPQSATVLELKLRSSRISLACSRRAILSPEQYWVRSADH